ncbi:MAG: hypothetical protein KKG75_00205 [Nanoarchaeota archaeon]|nr:hypothetical protein [Nanoarchaeota archaeon]
MTNVIKKGGKKQAFSPAKLKNSIIKAAKDAKLSMAKANQLVKDVAEPAIALIKKKRVVRVADIRKSILGRLDRKAKSVSNAWRRFEKQKKCK